MKPRLILVSLGLVALVVLALGLQAQERADGEKGRDDLILNEQQLRTQFNTFQDALLKLQLRLAKGTPEERRKSEHLGKVLKEISELAIDQEFAKLLEQMRTAKINNLRDLDRLKTQSGTLADKLRKVLELMQDSTISDLAKRTDDLRIAIDAVNKAIEATKIAETVTNRTDPKDLKKAKPVQENATKKTEDAQKKIDDILKGDDKGGKGGEAAPSKGDNKGEGKNEGKGGEAKNDGKPSPAEAKGSPKSAGDDSKGPKGETKPGSDKGGQPSKSGGEPKSGAKPGEKGKEGAPNAGAKENKGGDKNQQGNSKENKGGDKSGDKNKEGNAKDDGKKAGDPMKNDSPQGSAKGDDKKSGGDPKSADGAPPSDSKAKGGGDPAGGGGPPPKTAENKNNKGDGKGGEGKAGGDAKGGDGKQGEAKAGDSKSGQSSAKEGGAAPDAGNPMSPPPGGSAKDGGAPPPPGGGDKKPSKEQDNIAQSGKKVKEAGYDQKKAEEVIDSKDGKPKDALKAQADAIKKMEEAKAKLEQLLRQMREEEIERVLAALQARCEKMLAMQLEVQAGTKDTEAAILKRDGKKPDRLDIRAAQELSDKEKLIILEANKCIDILQSEGSAVAFPEVFQQLRTDMMHVQKRLDVTDVYATTQDIEQDIIDTLKEMIKALKEEQQKNKDDPGKSGPPGKSGKPADPKLLELIQELKMVRSLQKRVNDRTAMYGKRYPGEQAADPQVIRDLRSLADRQQRIQEIVRRIANGDNK